MITMLMYSHIKQELKILKSTGFEVSCRLSEDDWDFKLYYDMGEVDRFLSQNPIIDIALVDVSVSGAVALAEEMRRNSSALYIIVLADADISPVKYIRPTIMASSLMLRPINKQAVKTVFTESMGTVMCQRRNVNDQSGVFVIDNRDGKRLIPLCQISFFESRDKKIFVNTEYEEFSFYDTLDEIEHRLSDDFIRCHRSYIISKTKIKKIMLSQGVIILDGNFHIPLSRSYRKAMKELK